MRSFGDAIIENACKAKVKQNQKSKSEKKMESQLKVLIAYLNAFEEAYDHDDWNLLDAYFTEDATYEVRSAAPFGGKWTSLSAVKAQFKSIVDAFDRRFVRRIPESDGRPKQKGNALHFRWKARYLLTDGSEFVLSGNSIAYFRDGKIFELVDEISDELAIAAQVALQRQQAGE